MDFASKLLQWYGSNRRELPWRETRDPYAIWLSEVILQQTRINQGMSYWQKFLKTYPTVQELASASLGEVMKLWQGLGYYSRARNMHHTAQIIAKQYHGKFPETYQGLLQLKGVGPYTAAAIASFAFDEVVPVVDGNVIRVLSRIYGVRKAIDQGEGKKEIVTIAEKQIDPLQPADYNQAIMDFGSLHCVPRNPDCPTCPFAQECVARNLDVVDILPFKAAKVKIRKRYFNYLVLIHEGCTYIHKRQGRDIWEELFEFPLLETSRKTSRKELFNNDLLSQLARESKMDLIGKETFNHQLTHQHIEAIFYKIRITETTSALNTLKDFQKVDISGIGKYAIPRLIDRYIKMCGFDE